MQEKSLGAYNASSGWVASLTKEQRDQRQSKIGELEKKYVELGKDGGAVHHGASQVLTSAGTEGSIQASANFDPITDAETLRAAMKGMGARKQPIIDTLTSKSLGQRLEIRTAYEEHVKRDLFKDIDGEWQLNGNLARVLKVRRAFEPSSLAIPPAQPTCSVSWVSFSSQLCSLIQNQIT